MSYDSEVLADSPLRYWKLQDTAGTTAVDATGGSNGSYVGTPTLGEPSLVATEPTATSVRFPGSAATRVSTTDSAAMDVTRITVEAWIKTSDASGTPNIIGRDGGAAGNRALQFRLNLGKPELLIFCDGDTTATFTASGPTSVADGNPHHMVGTYDGVTVRIYIDGVEVGTQPFTAGGAHLTGNLSPSTYCYLASRTSSNNPFDGWLQKIAYYDHAISADRVAAHYAAGAATITSVSASGAGSRSARTGTASASETALLSSNPNGSYRAGRTATATATVSAPVNVFRPSLVEETLVWDQSTGLCLQVSRGLTLLLEDGSYRQVSSPSQAELEAADAYYLGGHRHEVSDATAAALTAAGYGDYLTTEQVVVRQ